MDNKMLALNKYSINLITPNKPDCCGALLALFIEILKGCNQDFDPIESYDSGFSWSLSHH
jgi:hypothetical protein